MLESLNHIDQSIFLTLNGLHSPFFDQFFWYATKPIVWLPLYVWMVILLIREFKWKTITILIAVALMIAASDQLANGSKYEVKRLRPTHVPEIELVVHTVNGYRGGEYGFYSAHASTNVAIAVFLLLFLRRRHRWLLPVLLTWAFIMAYSRIYLGVHYPGDILAGAVVGIFLAILFAWLTRLAMGLQERCIHP
ncbi:MAG: phosphatase PAP2 family protein [Bacteroidetes bacterium]|nr:MAG: phosphatase PAP2 family protein [Bacteroidota bacterium]